MKLIVEVETEQDRKEIETVLKNISGKITIKNRVRRPMESLLHFAESSSFPVEKVIIPGREERNER